MPLLFPKTQFWFVYITAWNEHDRYIHDFYSACLEAKGEVNAKHKIRKLLEKLLGHHTPNATTKWIHKNKDERDSFKRFYQYTYNNIADAPQKYSNYRIVFSPLPKELNDIVQDGCRIPHHILIPKFTIPLEIPYDVMKSTPLYWELTIKDKFQTLTDSGELSERGKPILNVTETEEKEIANQFFHIKGDQKAKAKAIEILNEIYPNPPEPEQNWGHITRDLNPNYIKREVYSRIFHWYNTTHPSDIKVSNKKNIKTILLLYPISFEYYQKAKAKNDQRRT